LTTKIDIRVFSGMQENFLFKSKNSVGEFCFLTSHLITYWFHLEKIPLITKKFGIIHLFAIYDIE